MKHSLGIFVIAVFTLMMCDDPVVDEPTSEKISIRYIQYSNDYTGLFWELADSSTFSMYRLEYSSDGIDYHEAGLFQDFKTDRTSIPTDSLDSIKWARIILVDIDENEIPGPAFEIDFDSQFVGFFNLNSVGVNDRLRLVDSVEYDGGEILPPGYEIGTNSFRWSTGLVHSDTVGEYEYEGSIEILPGQNFAINASSFDVASSPEISISLVDYMDQGTWQFDDDNSMWFTGEDTTFEAEWWRFATMLDSSIFTFYNWDTFRILGSVYTPDSSSVLDDIELEVTRNLSYKYTRGY